MTMRSQSSNGAAASPLAPFSIAVESQNHAAKIAPQGELDVATVSELQRELGRLIDTGPARIVIDLRGVEFLDSAGLHALLAAHSQAQRGNWELTIIPGSRAVQRIFDLTSTTERLPFATADCAATA